MNQAFITFRSVTFAQRGERLLNEGGIPCHLGRTPRWMEEQGCGYCLGLHREDLAKAADLLGSSRIPLRKYYIRREDGQLEEWAP